MTVPHDPLFWFLAATAVLLTGISKGGFGGALGAVAVPIMALSASPLTAAAIMLPLLCLIDWWGFRVYWRRWDARNLRILLPAAIGGVAVAAALSGVMSADVIRILVGAIAIFFTLSTWFGLAMRRPAVMPSTSKGALWGGLCGITSFLAHAGSPPLMMFLMPQRLDRTRYVATMNTVFLVVNAIKVVPYAWLGQFSKQNLLASLVLAPLVPLGVWWGARLHGRVDDRLFYRIVQVGLLLTGVQLVWQGAVSAYGR